METADRSPSRAGGSSLVPARRDRRFALVAGAVIAVLALAAGCDRSQHAKRQVDRSGREAAGAAQNGAPQLDGQAP
jgi:hypothetical protein